MAPGPSGWMPWSLCMGAVAFLPRPRRRQRASGRGVAPARLALGVGVVSPLWNGAVCGERRAGLSAPGDRQAVTAMGQHRHLVRKGEALNPLTHRLSREHFRFDQALIVIVSASLQITQSFKSSCHTIFLLIFKGV